MKIWKGGPEAGATGPVVITYTEFWPRRRRDLPAIGIVGVRLRNALCRMDGAVGAWLHADLGARRLGALSVWESEAHLRRFIMSPLHVPVMRKWPHRGTLRVATWRVRRYVPADAFVEARRRIEMSAPHPREPTSTPAGQRAAAALLSRALTTPIAVIDRSGEPLASTHGHP